MNGAKVDVANLETQFFPPALKMEHVQIADEDKPGRNLVEFDSFHVKLSGGALSHRKFVIEEGVLTGLKWNTPRADSGQLEDQGKSGLGLGKNPHLEALRKQISQLGKQWLKEAMGSAKSQLDPKNLETVQVSEALKQEWIARFAMYEQRVKDIETRVKNLSDFKAKGNTFQKIQAYRQAALEVQNLIAEAKRLRQELSQLGQVAGGDLQKIELARQRDLQNVQQKLKILSLDKEAISDALLGPELIGALEETMDWVKWTKDNVGQLTKIKKPERARGWDVAFPKPDDPHPGFLIKKLQVNGHARVNGKMVPYAGTLQNITSDPKRWGQPVILDVTTDGEAKIHLTATMDRTTEVPAYEVTVEYLLPKPTSAEWGDADKLAFRLSAQQTLWTAKWKLVGDDLRGRVTFHQADVRIEPFSNDSQLPPQPMQVASIEPVGFEWNSKQEMHRALAGVFSRVSELDAAVEVTGSLAKPQWTFSSSLGPQVKAGVESYLATEITRRKSQLIAEANALANTKLNGFREVLNEKFQKSVGRLNLLDTTANGLVQKFAAGPIQESGLNIPNGKVPGLDVPGLNGRKLDVRDLFKR